MRLFRLLIAMAILERCEIAARKTERRATADAGALPTLARPTFFWEAG